MVALRLRCRWRPATTFVVIRPPAVITAPGPEGGVGVGVRGAPAAPFGGIPPARGDPRAGPEGVARPDRRRRVHHGGARPTGRSAGLVEPVASRGCADADEVGGVELGEG